VIALYQFDLSFYFSSSAEVIFMNTVLLGNPQNINNLKQEAKKD